MPPKGWKKSPKNENEVPVDYARLGKMVTLVPQYLFVQMLSKAGLTTSETREMTDLYRQANE